MTEQEIAEIEEMIAVKLIPALVKMFEDKGINATITKSSINKDFVHLSLLFDKPNSNSIIKVYVDLVKNILYSRGCCSYLEKQAGFKNDAFSLPDMVKLRILWIVFISLRGIANGSLDSYVNHRNRLLISIMNNSGHLFYQS